MANNLLAEFEAMVEAMNPEELAQLDKLIEPELLAKWLPTPGPQSDAYFSKADLLLYGGGAGGGKMLDVNTPIPVPFGWSTMGQLIPGAKVFDERGGICTITAVSRVEVDAKTYRLTFDDGSEIVACADHQWLTFDAKELKALTRHDPEWRARRRAKRPSRATGNKGLAFSQAVAAANAARAEPDSLPAGSVRTTQQIVDTLLTPRGRRNHAIPVAGALQTTESKLKLDPYCLGAWLGDGSRGGGGFTGADPFIWEQFERAGYRVTHSPTNPYRHHVLGLYVGLRHVGVIDSKHIPPSYFRGSRDQRLALLQGLMDTDGHAALDGGCEFDNTSYRLIEGVYELVCSLGMKASITEGIAKLDGRIIGPKWRVKFIASEPVFRLPRKLARLQASPRRTTRFRYIVDAIEIDPVPMRCISVDSPSRLYLAGRSFIPTHNSQLLIGLALEAHERSVMFRRSFGDVAALADDMVTLTGRNGYAASPRPIYRRDGKLIEFGALESPGSEMSWQGRRHDFIGFDEGSQLTAAKIKFVMGWMGSPNPNQRCRTVIASNPPTGGDGGWMVEWFAPWLDPLFPKPADPGELRWAIIVGEETRWVDGPEMVRIGDESYTPMSRTFIPSLVDDNPYLADTGYKTSLQNMPEPLRSQLLHGDFLAGRSDHEWQVIPTHWIRDAQERWKRAPEKKRRMIALAADVAIGGADDNCLAPLHEDNWFAAFVIKKGVEVTDPSQIADLMMATRRDGADLSVDGTGGWGSGVKSHLKNHHQIACASLVFSTTDIKARTLDGRLGFANLRAQMYWRFREALDPESDEEIMLPPDPRLMAELAAPRYKIRGTDIILESKDEIKKRLGVSPDKSDAAVMAWHRRQYGLKPVMKTEAKKSSNMRARGTGWMGV